MWFSLHHSVRPESPPESYLVLLCLPGQLLDLAAAACLLCLPCGGEAALPALAGNGELESQTDQRFALEGC